MEGRKIREGDTHRHTQTHRTRKQEIPKEIGEREGK